MSPCLRNPPLPASFFLFFSFFKQRQEEHKTQICNIVDGLILLYTMTVEASSAPIS